MSLGEIIALSSLIAANAGINIGIYKYFNGRLDRVYARLDEVKEKINIEFVRRDICSVQHAQIKLDSVAEETRVEKRIDRLEQLVKENFQELIRLLEKR
jgi:hypothetical protein